MFLGMRNGSVSRMWPAAFLVIVSIVFSLSSVQEIRADETTVKANLTEAQEELVEDTIFKALFSVSKNSINLTNYLYEMRSKNGGNLLFSPFSIQSLLVPMEIDLEVGSNSSLTANADQLNRDLQLTHDAFEGIIRSLQDEGKINFSFAVDSYNTSDAFPAQKEFLEFTHTSFVSLQLCLGQEGNADATSETNHTPVFHQTQVNAFNLTAEWAMKFDKASTKSESFFLTPTQTKEVQMMHLASGSFVFLKSAELDCKVIELPYKGDKISLIVLLPNQLDGLGDLESKLPSLNFNQLVYDTEKHNVTVSLPKFKIEHSISTTRSISKAVERAVFEVNEQGTEGAATDAADNVGIIESQPGVQEVFKADHPFLFVLVERWTHIVLLMGRVATP